MTIFLWMLLPFRIAISASIVAKIALIISIYAREIYGVAIGRRATHAPLAFILAGVLESERG